MTPILELSSRLFPSASKESARTDGITHCITPLRQGLLLRCALGNFSPLILFTVGREARGIVIACDVTSCEEDALVGDGLVDNSILRGHPFMTSAPRGGGGSGKADKVREVA